MIDTSRRPQGRTTLNNTSSRARRGASSARRRHSASFSDAVIAAYIHELRHAATPRQAAADEGEAA
jgi:hypothetical protein